MSIRDTLAGALARAVEAMRAGGEAPAQPLPGIQLDVPPSPELGDYSSDVAVSLARHSREPASRIAEALAARLEVPEGLLERVQAGESGFLNFYLRPDWLPRAVADARRQGGEFGRSVDVGMGASVQVEFVSADPTGPLTVLHGRGAALGDTLANVLEWTGHRVTREYYVNDAGGQMERFARSLDAYYRIALGRPDVRLPADAHDGDYVPRLGAAIAAEAGDSYLSMEPAQRLAALRSHGRDAVLRSHRETLSRFGVRFDEWSSEDAVLRSGKLEEAVELLRRAGHAYEADGAVWLGSTAFGDEQDHPLVRSSGRPAYLAGDLAYHLDKFRRGFDRIIDLWGPDHRAYVRRTKAGIEALGCSPEALEILIFEGVAIKIDGVLVDDTALTGNNVLLDEVIQQVGADTLRFLYLTRPAGSPLELDLDLARTSDDRNPSRVVRRSLERAAAARDRAGAAVPDDPDLSPLEDPSDRTLMRKLSEFPDELAAAARERDPHRLTRYALQTAAALDAVMAENDSATERLALLETGAVVLGNALRVLGVEEGEEVKR